MPSPNMEHSHQDPPADSFQNDADADMEQYEDTASGPSTEQEMNGPETIAEGKQNAKAVLAASGVHVPESSHDASTPNSQSNGANGSTKRHSRDSAALPVRIRETPLEKVQLENYVNREFEHSAAAAWHVPDF